MSLDDAVAGSVGSRSPITVDRSAALSNFSRLSSSCFVGFDSAVRFSSISCNGFREFSLNFTVNRGLSLLDFNGSFWLPLRNLLVNVRGCESGNKNFNYFLVHNEEIATRNPFSFSSP